MRRKAIERGENSEPAAGCFSSSSCLAEQATEQEKKSTTTEEG